MDIEKRKEITKISKQFASGFKSRWKSINGTGFLIVDPLSGFLEAFGYKNELHEMPETLDRPQVLIIVFEDGDHFIPAGKDLNIPGCKNWMWISKEND